MIKVQISPIAAFFITAAAFLFLGNVQPNTTDSPNTPPQDSDSKKYFITLKDFTAEEVKGLGFTLSKDVTVHINAVGGGSKSAWKEIFGARTHSNDMFAAGWIIDADTREVVWEMTMDNTSGREENRTCEDEVKLKQGLYEVYYAAYGFSSSSSFGNYTSINIDRREGKSRNKFDKFLKWFDDDYSSLYDEFMDRARDEYGILLSVPAGEEKSVQTFNAPKKNPNTVFAATGVGDGAYVRKKLTVNKDVTLSVYALGEGRGRDEVFDYGWITNTDTRERVWEMRYGNTDYAGGASKNVLFNGDVRLSKGSYELSFVTDDSHSREDWNSKPPYDPFNYGVTIIAKDESDKSAVSVGDYNFEKNNIIVQLTRIRNNEFVQAGFTLKEETRLHVYALGEGDIIPRVKVMGKTIPEFESKAMVEMHAKSMADYGWIINAKTREHVWDMNDRNTTHAGGARKNRLADEFITLPAGNYLVFYQTDDSHAYNDWNDDKPFDAESYGITVMGAGENFNMKNITKFEETEDGNILAQLIKVRDDRHVHQKFTLEKAMKVRVYAIGEGVGNEMADYAWIENAKTGDVVWEMTYRTTTYAGGAKKNRMFDKGVYLEKGEYEVHYQTDDSHAFNDWNDDPPEDRTHWGVTIYKEQ
ncbi:MAG: hypothetical protein WCW40_02895 [Bacteroidota bacterium]